MFVQPCTLKSFKIRNNRVWSIGSYPPRRHWPGKPPRGEENAISWHPSRWNYLSRTNGPRSAETHGGPWLASTPTGQPLSNALGQAWALKPRWLRTPSLHDTGHMWTRCWSSWHCRTRGCRPGAWPRLPRPTGNTHIHTPVPARLWGPDPAAVISGGSCTAQPPGDSTGSRFLGSPVRDSESQS